MQLKISKTLEGIIARAAFNTTKEGMTHALKDFLALELLREEGALAYQLLSARLKDWELYQVRLRIEREIAAGKPQCGSPEEFYRAFAEELRATAGAVRSISTAHALLAIVQDRTTATAHVLEMYGITANGIAEEMQKYAAGDDYRTEIPIRLPASEGRRTDDGTRPERLLDRFGTDLTQLAREGRIDPVVGRDAEIERVVQILSRRRKNNPILIGEAGVGKSAVVEGLALRIARGEVPCTIADKRIFSLDVSSLVAGTKFRGEFEERMQQLLDELRRSRETILFIDEIHTIVGAGATQGSLDTANILKPVLARGELQTIGATTLAEYRANIESDTALERRFQRVLVEPTSPEQTLRILRNIAPRYEAHHRVRHTDDAPSARVELTARHVTDPTRRRAPAVGGGPAPATPRTAASPTRRSTCSTKQAPARTSQRPASRRSCAASSRSWRRRDRPDARPSKRWSTSRRPRRGCAKAPCVRCSTNATRRGGGRARSIRRRSPQRTSAPSSRP